MPESDKTLFEIYRETGYARGYRSIFYTDLEEHARDKEIARAATGETLVSGFIRDDAKEQARVVVDAIMQELEDLDEDQDPEPEAIRARLRPFLVP